MANDEVAQLTKKAVMEGLLFMKYHLPQLEWERIQLEKRIFEQKLFEAFTPEQWKRFAEGPQP